MIAVWSISIAVMAIILSQLPERILYFGILVLFCLKLFFYLGDAAYLAGYVGVVLEAAEVLAADADGHDGDDLCGVLACEPAVGVVVGGDDDEGLVFVFEIEVVGDAKGAVEAEDFLYGGFGSLVVHGVVDGACFYHDEESVGGDALHMLQTGLGDVGESEAVGDAVYGKGDVVVVVAWVVE